MYLFSYKFNTRSLIFMICGLFIFSCYYDNEEELYEDNICNTENISYSNDIIPILNRNCQLCHSATTANTLGAGFNLEGYDNLKIHVASGALLGSVKHEAGWSPMPKGAGKIPNCDIEKIQSWINNGSPNN